MEIVPPSRAPREPRITTRPKALILTALSVVWVLLSVAVAAFDLSPQFHMWKVIRVAVWILQGILPVAATCCWRFERPREIKLKGGMPEPPVIRGV